MGLALSQVITISFPKTLEILRQYIDEPLSFYYHRTIQVTSHYGVRNRIPEDLPLSILKTSILDLIYGAFLGGLTNGDLRYKAIRGNTKGRFLHLALVAIEEAHNLQVTYIS